MDPGGPLSPKSGSQSCTPPFASLEEGLDCVGKPHMLKLRSPQRARRNSSTAPRKQQPAPISLQLRGRWRRKGLSGSSALKLWVRVSPLLSHTPPQNLCRGLTSPFSSMTLQGSGQHLMSPSGAQGWKPGLWGCDRHTVTIGLLLDTSDPLRPPLQGRAWSSNSLLGGGVGRGGGVAGGCLWQAFPARAKARSSDGVWGGALVLSCPNQLWFFE